MVTIWSTVIYFVFVLLKRSPVAHRIHLPAGRHASTHSVQRTELAAGQLSRFHHHKTNGLQIRQIWTQWNIVWGATLEACRKLKTKAKKIASASGYLGQPATGTDRQSCERLLKRLKVCVGAGSGHFERLHWQWNSGIWSLVNCVVSTMLLNWCCSRNIFECWKIGRRSC